ELGLDENSSGRIDDALARSHTGPADFPHRTMDRHSVGCRIDLVAEGEGAASDHVLVATDPAPLEKCVPSLLEIGQRHCVVDVPQCIEILPAHLDSVTVSI